LVGSPDSCGSVVKELDPVGEWFFVPGWCSFVWKQGWMSVVASGGDRLRGTMLGLLLCDEAMVFGGMEAEAGIA
jgi:hypothetical protein